jgi:hypothetical protein
MIPDEQRIIGLLCGRTTRDERGLLHTYLKDGSDEEKEARRALARLLRTSRPLDLGVRYIIADLIDPDFDEMNRRIRFENRRKGKPSDAAAEKQVAEFIWSQRQTGVTMKRTVIDATAKFGLNRSRVLAIWKIWRPILQRLKRIDLDGNPVNPFVQHNRD